jgi:asparagine synthase (glutamine-hydrolysing)
MCGISGVLSAAGAESAPLRRMGETQAHRGPDHFATWLDGPVGLAHNRLSLLDLSPAGHQPFLLDGHALVFNGELYNFRELRAELLADGAVLRSTSDTEVLLHLLLRHGVEKTLGRIRGMFAFAFWHSGEQRLFLARDRMGIKPLFYWQRPHDVLFASELKALLAAGTPEIEPVRVFYSPLGVLEKARRHTAFRGIRQVEPGSYVVLEAGRESRAETYFRLVDLADETTWRRLGSARPEAVLEEFSSLFGQSIESMRVADAPMGAFVSGGVDSGLIAARSADAGGERIQPLSLFTAAVEGPYSETEHARALARKIGRQLHESPFSGADFLASWVATTWHYESPVVVHTNAAPLAAVARLASRHGVKAVLTGEGADEAFLGYPPQLAARYDGLLRFPYRLLDRVYGLFPPLRRFVTQADARGLEGELEKLAQNLERQTLRREGLERLSFLPPAERREQYTSYQLLSEGLLALLWRNDRMGMSAGIEARFPFLDENLLHFALNLPIRYKIGRSAAVHNWKHPFLVDKALVRRLAARELPADAAYRVKNGFPSFGLRQLEVGRGFLENGFWQQLLGLSHDQLTTLTLEAAPYDLARFAAVDLWGRLFVLGEPRESLEEHVRRHARLRP